MHKKDGLNIKRYPASTNRSLQAWSAADELILKHIDGVDLSTVNVITYGDSFGYLTAHIEAKNHFVLVDTASQKGAITKNLNENKIKPGFTFINPLQKTSLKPKIGLLKIPKSLALFELYLDHFTQNCSVSGKLICGFMTRHFSKQMIDIASKYFENVSQSKAVKKSRLLILDKPIKQDKNDIITPISLNNDEFLQYFGVFSSKMIDPASQYLIDYLPQSEGKLKAMDLGCGNGVLGKMLIANNPNAELHLVDDSYLAIESAKLNLSSSSVHFNQTHTLLDFDENSFDLIVTNPPFHVEHEIDISLPIRLFKEAHRLLKPGGHLLIVSNLHLNYKTHLVKIYSEVEVLANNAKYEVYKCVK